MSDKEKDVPKDWRDLSLIDREAYLRRLMEDIIRVANIKADRMIAEKRFHDNELDDYANIERSSGKAGYEAYLKEERNRCLVGWILSYIGSIQEETVDRFWKNIHGSDNPDEDLTKKYKEFFPITIVAKEN